MDRVRQRNIGSARHAGTLEVGVDSFLPPGPPAPQPKRSVNCCQYLRLHTCLQAIWTARLAGQVTFVLPIVWQSVPLSPGIIYCLVHCSRLRCARRRVMSCASLPRDGQCTEKRGIIHAQDLPCKEGRCINYLLLCTYLVDTYLPTHVGP